MKWKYILPLAIMTLGSCSKDFLDQTDPNATSIDNYFKTENDVLLAVNGLYQALRNGNTLGETSSLYSEQRSDNTGTNDNQSNSGEPFQFNNFSLLPSNSYLKTHWVDMYDGIARCNTLLAHIDEVTFSSEDTKKRYMAEAKFIRALLYSHMVRKWGAIPLTTIPPTTTDEVSAIAYRQDESVVYAQIVQDLTEALDSNLPNEQWDYAVGRVSKAAINALLGQIYLTMGSTLSENTQTNLQQAETYLSAAYNMRSFGELKEIPYTDVFDVNKKNTCKELVFQIQYLQGDQNYSSAIARNNQAKGETINSLKPSTGSGGMAKRDLVNDYEQGDLRKDFSVKFAADPQVSDWFITKFRDASPAAGEQGWGGNDWIVIRYADIMLLLAETKMKLGKDGEAIALLDQVRARAGMSSYQEAMQNAAYATRYPTLKEAILHERRVELAFENHRWFDLIRNYTAAELVAYFKAKSQSEYGLANLNNINTKDRYFPIPYDEYQLDPEKMYQNPGY